jgi:hypothetical protein
LDIFLRNFSYVKKIKFLRKDSDQSYLHVETAIPGILKLEKHDSQEKVLKSVQQY